MTTTDTLIIGYLTGHDHATFNDLYQAINDPIIDLSNAIINLEQRGTITRNRLHGHDTWTLTTTPDTPATPTPPTIQTGTLDGHLVLDPDDRHHIAWLTRELARADGRDPSLMDAYRFEEDAAVVAKALRAMRDQQPAEDPASFEGDNRATPSAAQVVDAIAASIGKRVGVDPATGDPRLEDKPTLYGYVGKPTGPGGTYQVGDEVTHVATTGPAGPTSVKLHLFGPDALRIGQSDGSTLRLPADGSPATIEEPRTELRQPSFDVAKAVVDELEARMRDRLRAWGLQCENTNSDQETQP